MTLPHLRRAAVLVPLALAAILAAQTPTQAAGHTVMLHLKTGITQDDNQMCAAFNVALAALEAGDEVEMFFDAAALFDLQDAPSRGGADEAAASQPTASQPAQGSPAYNLKYKLPAKLKAIVSQEFGIAVEDLPQTYFDYLGWLEARGVHVTFNGAMAHLVSLSDSVTGTEAVTDLATPLTLTQIVEHRAQADVYFAY